MRQVDSREIRDDRPAPAGMRWPEQLVLALFVGVPCAVLAGVGAPVLAWVIFGSCALVVEVFLDLARRKRSRSIRD